MPKPKKLSPKAANALVCEIATDVSKALASKVMTLAPNTRWLIYSRALNLVFRMHYNLNMELAERETEARDV